MAERVTYGNFTCIIVVALSEVGGGAKEEDSDPARPTAHSQKKPKSAGPSDSRGSRRRDAALGSTESVGFPRRGGGRGRVGAAPHRLRERHRARARLFRRDECSTKEYCARWEGACWSAQPH